MEGLSAAAIADDKVARVVFRVDDRSVQRYCAPENQFLSVKSNDWQEELDVPPACVSHLSLVPVVGKQPILKNKPTLLITLNKPVHWDVFEAIVQYLDIICPFIKPALRFWAFGWLLLFLGGFCHFRLLLLKEVQMNLS